MPSEDIGYRGIGRAEDQTPGYNEIRFVVMSLMARMSFCAPVEVMAVTNAGGVSPVGFVDVKPLINQTDGQGNAIEHGTIYNIPYIRVQGGDNAVIIDPQVGDIGMCSFADRDISILKSTKTRANPGSKRKLSKADGIYTGGILNGTPSQYVRFADGIVELVGTNQLNVKAPNVAIEASTQASITAPTIALNGNLTMAGETGGSSEATLTGNFNITGTIKNNGKNIGDTHTHNNVQPGSGNSGSVN
ncbi:oxidoreductase [Pandoraea terrigena]|uniref:Uncharacterized protein n=1 Tax=Pandoraea terrigena TaxID=2508292 RepID=A0A5E4V5S8_9BURK|nr:oxidoreductase [Pandoraea terrigena]VVE07627.1 hypothetical protein PTE31013_02474 [Pandoraea terrigena]